jgi:ribonuclease HI
VDGSFSDREGAGGAGLVLHNSDGKVLLAACVHLPNCDEAEEAKAHAALLGLRYLGNAQQNLLILETDCSAVVKALQSKDQDRSKWCAIYEEAKSFLNKFTVSCVIHVNRVGNSVADALARLARSGCDQFFGDAIPNHTRELVNSDCKLLVSR